MSRNPRKPKKPRKARRPRKPKKPRKARRHRKPRIPREALYAVLVPGKHEGRLRGRYEGISGSFFPNIQFKVPPRIPPQDCQVPVPSSVHCWLASSLEY